MELPRKEITQGTMPGARRRGRPRTVWMDNIRTWSGLTVDESIKMAEDRDKWRKYVHGVANTQSEDDCVNTSGNQMNSCCRHWRSV